MTAGTKAGASANALISVMLGIASIQFAGLADPWLSASCGAGAALSLWFVPSLGRHLLFVAIACLSLLQNTPWFLNAESLIFGLAGATVSGAIQFFPQAGQIRSIRRLVQSVPFVLIASSFPLTSSLLPAKSPKRAILEGGVWATIGTLEDASASLSTKHQYTYERFREQLGARMINVSDPLSEVDELIIITPTTPFEPSFVDKVKEWTSRGGKLLVVADHTNLFGHQTVLKPLLAQFGIAIRPDALFETQTNGGIYSNPLNEFAGLTPCSISSGVVPRLRMTGWSEDPNYRATSFFGDLEPTNDDRFGRHTVLGSRRVGRGEISVFTDSTFFANFAISRWSSQAVLRGLFWPAECSLIALAGIVALIWHFAAKNAWPGFVAAVAIMISPSVGFHESANAGLQTPVELAPPRDVENDSEERDKGSGSALLASAYAFGVKIRWNKDAPLTFEDYVRSNGLALAGASENEIPRVDLADLAGGRFYLDQNSFWFGQGAGLLRSVNMGNLWRSLGADVPVVDLTITGEKDEEMTGKDGRLLLYHFQYLTGGWAVIDHRIVARWVPETSRWLARKEWQFGPWLEQDLSFEPKS